MSKAFYIGGQLHRKTTVESTIRPHVKKVSLRCTKVIPYKYDEPSFALIEDRTIVDEYDLVFLDNEPVRFKNRFVYLHKNLNIETNRTLTRILNGNRKF